MSLFLPFDESLERLSIREQASTLGKFSLKGSHPQLFQRKSLEMPEDSFEQDAPQVTVTSSLWKCLAIISLGMSDISNDVVCK